MARRAGDPWIELHGLLRSGMADAFARVAEPGLGADLRASAEAAAAGEDEAPAELVRWIRALGRWDGLGRNDRSVLVARGMRLCLTLHPPGAGAPRPRTPRPRRTRDAELPAPEVQTSRAAEPLPASPAPADRPEPASVRTLPGVGPATAAKLEARGLATVADLVLLLPSGYHDRRERKAPEDVPDGEVAVIEAAVGGLRQGFARGRFMATLQLRADDGRGGVVPVVARWFHRIGGLERWPREGRVVAIGPLRRHRGQLTMAHPELRPVGDEGPAIAVRYAAVEGIPARTLARLVGAAVDRIDDPAVGLADSLPRSVAEAHGLPGLLEALRFLHRPPDDLPPEAVAELAAATSAAHRRLMFEEFFWFQLALLLDRHRLRSQGSALRLPPDAIDRERVRAALPFEPTAAQWRVLGELEADMAEGPPMLRLLQGDVGSGKTAVAFAAALGVVAAGGQVALMAPTEILAEQHRRTLGPWCERAGLRLALLTGATPRAQRTSLLALLAAGEIDVLVGTHALLTADVAFRELGLCIVDEQHRFGVEQRAVLRQKGALPHLLVMTATPIPRTLALCAHGELEVSVIDELPPGRVPAQTRLYTGKRGLDRARDSLRSLVEDRSVRAFVVCPLVEASEALEVTDVEATAAALRERLGGHRIGIVHGRMSSRDKDAVMDAFRRGELDVLVATTVIEVGVDVPEATVILVEHAERFGLAQLHQLRGRVGRAGGSSHCLLHTAFGPSSDAAKRLEVLTETADGFVVAERDLAFRGPGEVLGTRQAGAPRLRFAGFAGEGTRLLVEAREAAQRLLGADPGLARHPELLAELRRRRVGESVFAADAG